MDKNGKFCKLHNEVPRSLPSAVISNSSVSPSEIIQEDTLTYSVTKVEI